MLFKNAVDSIAVLCSKKDEVNIRDIVIRIKWQDRLGLSSLLIQFISKNDFKILWDSVNKQPHWTKKIRWLRILECEEKKITRMFARAFCKNSCQDLSRSFLRIFINLITLLLASSVVRYKNHKCSKKIKKKNSWTNHYFFFPDLIFWLDFAANSKRKQNIGQDKMPSWWGGPWSLVRK